MTAGVQRQYTARPGGSRTRRSRSTWRTRSAWVRVHRPGALPAPVWTGGTARCRAAGVPGDSEFATKPALARLRPAALVTLATAPPGDRPQLPLPAPPGPRRHLIDFVREFRPRLFVVLTAPER